MWLKILVGVVVATFLFFGLGVFLQGSSSSFIEARVEQAHSEMSEVAEALREAYRKYDESDIGEDPRFREFEFGRVDRLWPTIFRGYMKVSDPFDPEKGFYLAATLRNDFILISPGPNKFIDISPRLLEEAMRNGSDLDETVANWKYDSDRGMKSEGDLFVIQRFDP